MLIFEELNFDIPSGRMLSCVAYEYSGPVAECGKKYRKTQDQIVGDQRKLAGEYKAIQSEERAKAEPFVSSLMATKPGELSPLAQAEYGSQLREIEDTYGRLMDMGLGLISRRGFGSMPGGAYASMTNSMMRDRGRAETEAYTGGQRRTYEQGLAGLGYRQGQQQVYAPSNVYAQASQSNQGRAQMGSTLGDIATGVKLLAPKIPGTSIG